MMGCGVAAAGNEAAADNFAGNQFGDLRAVLGADVLEINRLALEEREQEFLRDRVVAVILFQDLQRVFAGGVAQDDGVRLHLRGRAGIDDGIRASLEVERHGVADDGEVLVVNGERGFGNGRIFREHQDGYQQDSGWSFS